jgi:hypothetical protein
MNLFSAKASGSRLANGVGGLANETATGITVEEARVDHRG